jgi:type II secretory pathway predicted ATPase ExeA
MYLDHWKLACRPFDRHEDPRFYYPSQTHQAALLQLHYAVQNRQGGALLTGMSGLGKTRLVDALFDSVDDTCQPQIHLRFPQMSPESLVAYLAAELTGHPSGDRALDVSLRCIETFLAENARQGRHALIVIDEAHVLCGTDGLETVRLLLNYESDWTMLMVAQPAILPALQRMPELEERLGVKCLLHRFSADETAAYVSHRLRAAGAPDVESIFEPRALEALHQRAEGIPRRINRLADMALLTGFAEEQSIVQADHLQTIADELEFAATGIRQAA